MISVNITDKMVTNAKKRAEELGVLNNSFMSGRGNIVGFLGEEILLSILTGSLSAGDFEYDIIYDKIKLEVKTKKTTARPKPNYLCSISTFNMSQKTDYYAFCRVDIEKMIGWVCGFIKKEDFHKKCIFMKKGDPEGDNGYIVKSDCMSLPISDLQTLNDFKKEVLNENNNSCGNKTELNKSICVV